MKKLIRFLLAITLILGLLAPSFSVSATPANPDSITLHTAKAFENVFETGDMLFIVSYNVNYAIEPSEFASDTFLVNLLSINGTSLLMSRPLNDYQYNVISILATAAQVTSLGLTWNSEYQLRITGNPAIFGTLTEGTNMATKTLSISDWNADGSLTSKALLALHIIDLANTLETEWAITLLVTTTSGNQVLNSAGRTAFILAIPALDIVIPLIFQSTSGVITIDPVTSNATLQGNSTMLIRLGPQISSAFTGIGTWLGISQSMSGGLWALLFILTIASITFLSVGNGTAAMLSVIPLMIGLSYVGAIPVALLFTIVILLIAYTGYFLILRGI